MAFSEIQMRIKREVVQADRAKILTYRLERESPRTRNEARDCYHNLRSILKTASRAAFEE